MSGMQDSLIGRKERTGENLNWSATCSYYSLVHVGRLVSFLALGDYPTSHAELRKLMSGSADRSSRRPHSDFPFDWLRDFIQPVRSATIIPPPTLLDLRSCILEYLNEIAVPNGGSRLEDFGRIFRAAAPLRNDSNYEALLIAHEYRHVDVSPAFRSLAEHFQRAADDAVLFAVDVFKNFVENDVGLEPDRQGYRSFLQQYIDVRLVPGISRKLGGRPDLETRLQELALRLRVPANDGDFSKLEEAASINIFSGKVQLMRRFAQRIEDLGLAVRGEVN